MTTSKITVTDILNNIISDRKIPFNTLHNVIVEHLPNGFETAICYGMISYIVPHSLYPAGYHCKPQEPLQFAAIASQKNAITLYHLGLYGNTELMDWWRREYPKYSKQKLDMGKGCVRFKNFDDLPFQLVGELMSKITVPQWIAYYEANLKK